LGNAQRAQGNDTGAEESYRKAMQGGSSSVAGAQAMLAVAELRLKRGAFEQARLLADSVLVSRSDENAAQAQFLLGDIQFAQRKFDDARLAFMRVKLVYANFPEWVGLAQLRIADCYREVGNRAAALEAYREVVSTHSSDSLGTRARRQVELLGGR
jgi:TolA-binding protein